MCFVFIYLKNIFSSCVPGTDSSSTFFFSLLEVFSMVPAGIEVYPQSTMYMSPGSS